VASKLIQPQVRTAILSQINRALVTSPEPLPDTIATVMLEDQPWGASWSFTRPAFAPPVIGLPHIVRTFLMPHFSFWAWAPKVVGSIPRAAAAIDKIEAKLAFADKDPRAVWRGTTEFNSAHHPKLRDELVRVAQGKPWADVEALEWEKAGQLGFEPDDAAAKQRLTFQDLPLVGARSSRSSSSNNNSSNNNNNNNNGNNNNGNNTTGPLSNRATGHGGASNSMMIEDFCRYKYVIHTEGVTYSGRFQFLQMCNSVMLTPAIAWLQHTTHLVKPLFSSDLALPGRKPPSWVPSAGEREAWPRHYKPGEANLVFVASDWSDLESVVGWLENHPRVAEGIAARQRELFVGGGYLSPAAEVCYWRALVRGWSKVVELEDEGEWAGVEGVRWETFALGNQAR
jgi:hypothetical protein